MAISVGNKTSCNAKENILFLAPSYPYVRQVIHNLSGRLNQKKIPFNASSAGGRQYLNTDTANIEFVYCDPIDWTADTFKNRNAVFGKKELLDTANMSVRGWGYLFKRPTVSLERYIIDLANGGNDSNSDVELPTTYIPKIKNVHFNNPMTVVIWEDGTKTMVKCQDGDVYSNETGLALCIAKKALGNKGNFNEVFKKWIPEEETCCAKPMTFMEVEISHDFIRSEDISKAVEKIFTDAWKNFKQRGVF